MGAQESTAAAGDNDQLPRYTMETVAKHNTNDDLWVVIDGKVYDVTEFMEHPGGRQLFTSVAGQDASVEFEDAMHSDGAKETMNDWLVGIVGEPTQEQAEQQKQLEQAAAAEAAAAAAAAEAAATTAAQVQVLFGTQTGTAEAYARRVAKACEKELGLSASVCAMDDFEPEDFAEHPYLVFCVSTFTDGTAPKTAKFMTKWLEDAALDFRVQKGSLAQTRYAVLGLGNSLYEEHYNVIGRRVHGWMRALGATPLCALGEADGSVSRNDNGTQEKDFTNWVSKVLAPALRESQKSKKNNTKNSNNQAKVAAVDDDYVYDDEDVAATGNATAAANNAGAADDTDKLLDLEDIGSALQTAVKDGKDEDKRKKNGNLLSKKEKKALRAAKRKEQRKVDRKEEEELMAAQSASDGEGLDESGQKRPVRAMLTDALRRNLSKQGYHLIGSHSGVKLCRWTKAMLRGRGGCYKHTFYGIKSYQCMEMTPSLACANKCVFCWRHHTNPVGKEWRWEVDNPRMIIDAAIAGHRQMVKQMKGVPGVKPERFAEASTIKHCALSLVGEPIMYPHINEYLNMLHEEGISSFLVTNAQFPDRIAQLSPVTQLYVSIDASTQESLKAVDRPLFKDFWQRFLDCLSALRVKEVRTVYRLTLLKGQGGNMQDVAEYAKLVGLGRPSFIEVKGVTFCGNQNASSMTMKNVPWHEEVRDFCRELCKYLEGDYELASEHVHSCCILIADKRFKGEDGTWNTHIDYPKFHQLQARWRETGETFTALDYTAPTPSWAVFGAPEGGFDPVETRWRRNKKDKNKLGGKQAKPVDEEAKRAEAAAAAAPDKAQ